MRKSPQNGSSSLIYMSLWLLAASAAIAYITTIINDPRQNTDNKYAAFIPGSGISKTEKQLKNIEKSLNNSNRQLGRLNNNYYVLESKIGNLQHAITELDHHKSSLSNKVSRIEETLGSVTGALPTEKKKSIKAPLQEKKPLITTIVKKTPAQSSEIPLPILQKQQQAIIKQPQLSHTQFALELGNYASIKQLKSAWARLSSKHSSALRPLKPRYITIVVNNQARYKLVSGPVRNALDAAKICYHLQQSKVSCQQTIYHGSDI